MTNLYVSGGSAKTQVRAVVSLTASGIVAAGVSGKRLKVYTYSLQTRNDGMSVQFTDGAGGANLTHVWSLNQREGACPPSTMPTAFIFATSVGNPIFAAITGTGTVDIDLSYWNDDPS